MPSSASPVCATTANRSTTRSSWRRSGSPPRKGRMNGDLHRLGVVLTDARPRRLHHRARRQRRHAVRGRAPGGDPDVGRQARHRRRPADARGHRRRRGARFGNHRRHVEARRDGEAAAGRGQAGRSLLPPKQDDDERLALKAQRKERKAIEREEARLRREQIARRSTAPEPSPTALGTTHRQTSCDSDHTRRS